MTKRIKYLSLLLAVIMCFSLLTFVGCDSEQETANNFNYDQLLEMPIEYVGESDRIVFESWDQYKEYISSRETARAAVAAIECIDTVFYITVRHDGEDIMTSGKAVSRCKVVAVGEKFNNCNIENGAIVEIVQNYYLYPRNNKVKIEMFESFGADFEKNLKGEVVGMKIDDGDYALKIKDVSDYKLKIFDSVVLPMEPGVKYTGVVWSGESTNFVEYLSPAENTQKYDVFRIDGTTKKIAAEVKQSLDIESAK